MVAEGAAGRWSTSRPAWRSTAAPRCGTGTRRWAPSLAPSGAASRPSTGSIAPRRAACCCRPTSGYGRAARRARRGLQAPRRAGARAARAARAHRLRRAPSDGRGGTKPAVTVFAPIASCAEPRCSLVLAMLLTGRTHQIRRHLRDLSHPVLGDARHGDTRVNRDWRARGLHRLALHCLSLDTEGPTGPIAARAPLPPELASVCAALPWWPAALAALPEPRRRDGSPRWPREPAAALARPGGSIDASLLALALAVLAASWALHLALTSSPGF
ncbi:MAG: pseudouridine synthase [Myxococcota bacterium]